MNAPRASVRFSSDVWAAIQKWRTDHGIDTVSAAVRALVVEALSRPTTPAEVRGWRAGYEQGLAEFREQTYEARRKLAQAAESITRGK